MLTDWARALLLLVEIDRLMSHRNYSDDKARELHQKATGAYQHSTNDLFPDAVYQICDVRAAKHWNSVWHNNVDRLADTLVQQIHHRSAHRYTDDYNADRREVHTTITAWTYLSNCFISETRDEVEMRTDRLLTHCSVLGCRERRDCENVDFLWNDNPTRSALNWGFAIDP